jgi:uncharacterized protein YegL
MRGEPIRLVNVGLQAALSAMRQDPYAIEIVYLSIISFDVEAREIIPLTALGEIRLKEITAARSGAFCLGAALELLVERVDRDVKKTAAEAKGDWHPLLFVMTDGNPSDLQAYRKAIGEIRKRKFRSILACVASPKAKQETLLELTDRVVALDIMDTDAWRNVFWDAFDFIESSVKGSMRTFDGLYDLPPPPPEISITVKR